MEGRARIHEMSIVDIQDREQNIASRLEKAKKCSHALGVMLEAGTLKDVIIDVIRGLIADFAN